MGVATSEVTSAVRRIGFCQPKPNWFEVLPLVPLPEFAFLG